MEKSKKKPLVNEPLLFAKESIPPKECDNYFKLLIVDDENEIHVMTKLVLSDYVFMGAGLKFLSAFSAKEAKTVIRENPDIACCLLDVVMETNDAGLEVARFIREDENNKKLRIILRTGQPGKAPEKNIILTYDINDYKEKTELTNQKLFTTITTALRSYIHLEEIEKKNNEIQTKNIRLNEEIARRIVAESNLTKYNRSLEKMIENKSSRLKAAILNLEETKEKLRETKKKTITSDISSRSLETFHTSNTMIDTNLKKMDHYGQAMTRLLEKYDLLEKIIRSQKGETPKKEQVSETIQKIDNYKRQIDLDTLLKEYPEIIKESAKGIQQIATAVSDIKLFMSINEEPFQTTDMGLLLKKNTIIGNEATAEKIDIQWDLEEVPSISLPPRHMEKALNAIFKNAFQAISSKGIISVSCQYLDPNIIVSVSDIGCGISKEDLPHVFTPYFTGNQKKGKGLGLTFAKNVIQNCNGELNITSSRHEGTTVKIILPVK